MPSDPVTVKCPKCGHEFPLEDAVLGSVREHLSEELEATVREREKKLRAGEEALRKRRSEVDDEVEEQLKQQLAEVEARAAKKAAEAEATRVKAFQEELAEKSAALQKAREAELAFARKERQLKEDREQLELELEKKLSAERDKLKEQIARQEAERQSVKQAELEKKLQDAVKANDDLRRKLEQGSQQTQGEVLELELENRLKSAFPLDHFEEVPKGVRGADLIHLVANHLGHPCGRIVYETKQTKAWSKDWIPKLKDDLAKVRGDVAVLITSTLPDGVTTSAQIDGVWVCAVPHALPLIHTLRWALLELSRAKAASEGMEDNKDLLYRYFTGPEFRNRLETIVQTFDAMRTTLAAEKKALSKHWAAREKQIDKVVLHLSGMQGDIQGIAGGGLDTLELLDLEDE
ncbi:MAG: DUF2130 domain-containing protein [Akkermansiaceae bacterium]|nr:DUF2130 domain-containing protein [Akkermansiaceae bacterium]NNM27950.1 DUF2130 domain-containing protein [Akkermansiaceae bacterium]